MVEPAEALPPTGSEPETPVDGIVVLAIVARLLDVKLEVFDRGYAVTIA